MSKNPDLPNHDFYQQFDVLFLWTATMSFKTMVNMTWNNYTWHYSWQQLTFQVTLKDTHIKGAP